MQKKAPPPDHLALGNSLANGIFKSTSEVTELFSGYLHRAIDSPTKLTVLISTVHMQRKLGPNKLYIQYFSSQYLL